MGGAQKRSMMKALARRHGGDSCVYCRVELTDPPADGSPLPSTTRTIDHIIPRCRGGRTTMTNLWLSCRACNESKSDRLPLEFVTWRSSPCHA